MHFSKAPPLKASPLWGHPLDERLHPVRENAKERVSLWLAVPMWAGFWILAVSIVDSVVQLISNI